jgi:hypothetical protein
MPRRGFSTHEPDQAGPHCGWWRAGPRQPWRQLAEGANWRACWLALRRQGRAGDTMILPEGRTPYDQDQLKEMK